MPIYRKFLAFVLLLALPYGLVAYRFATCGQGCEISGDGMLVILALVLFLPFVLAGIVVAAILFGGLGLRRDLRSRSPIGAAIGVVLLGWGIVSAFGMFDGMMKARHILDRSQQGARGDRDAAIATLDRPKRHARDVRDVRQFDERRSKRGSAGRD